jgi:23S rRNA (cytidine1920-2'-O)/16S rRNA (cytidine1409-2'-O)-methyltransferase
VSRGGIKLGAALDSFSLEVSGRVCLDVGASTGGFTQVLIARGARRVYAVDVGRDQLHPSLRGRNEIVSIEGADIRALDPSRLPERPDFATIDVSFISLKLVLPGIGKLLRVRARLVALIKIVAFLAAQGWSVGGVAPSPILGGDGNREFFIEAERG